LVQKVFSTSYKEYSSTFREKKRGFSEQCWPAEKEPLFFLLKRHRPSLQEEKFEGIEGKLIYHGNHSKPIELYS
jgi:hypothetical protein